MGLFGRVQAGAVLLLPEKHQSAGSIPSQFRVFNVFALGVRAWGGITMAGGAKSKERRAQVSRYRMMEQETTDPLAAGLLHGIVLELEAEIDEEPIAPSDLAVEPVCP
jgi:hypothetical protein